MTKAEDSKKVRVHYTGSLDDGTVFDSSQERDPLEFTIGSNEIIPAVENAVKGMEEGEEKQVKVPPTEAYGERNEQAIMEVSKSQLPSDVDVKVGTVLQGSTQDGDTMRLQVTEVNEDSVTVDANHPLAGQNLNFDLKLVEVVE
ncbi:MAG: FKBP-type peptidyl-prolyl cis-trans isomerase [Planctomycetota bacterium]